MFFDDERQEYVIKNMYPRRPLINYLWNEDTVWWLNEFGTGESLACIGEERRTITKGDKIVYLKFDDGSFYSPNMNFKKENFDTFEAHVGLGYHRVIGEYKGLKTELTFILPDKGFLECYNIKVSNTSKENKHFHLYYYFKPFVHVGGHTSCSKAGYSEEYKGIFYSHISYHKTSPLCVLYVKSDKDFKSYTVEDEKFVGFYNYKDNPIGLTLDKLPSTGATLDDIETCVLQYEVNLKPGEEESYNITLSIGFDEDYAYNQAIKVNGQKEYLDMLNYQKELHKKYNSVLTVKTPDEYFNRLSNVWLKRQVSLGKTWGRVYGRGFRDVMQDICGFVSMDISLARDRILYALKHQFINGNTIRMYDPIFNEPYNDGAAWIPETITMYIKESGDFSLLNEMVGYFDSDTVDSVFDHMTRGMNFLTTSLGKHNLVLWGGGDWNDSLNNCGNKGIGESVWLSIATVKALNEYIELCNRLNKDTSIYETRKQKLIENIYKYGFEGDRFIYGYNDLGEEVGSIKSKQAQLYLNPQTWAVLANISTKEVVEKTFKLVDDKLKCNFGYKQCDPPYTTPDYNLGRATYMIAGLVENASVYNHGVSFKIASDCKLKDGDLAYNDFKLLSPNNPLNKNNGMEEYAISNMYIGPDYPFKDMVGFAPWSWVTGTAGWLYRDLTEGIIGVKASYDGLFIDPVLPSEWSEVTVKRVYRNNIYDISIKRSNDKKIICDGKILDTSLIKYDGKDHKVELYI